MFESDSHDRTALLFSPAFPEHTAPHISLLLGFLAAHPRIDATITADTITADSDQTNLSSDLPDRESSSGSSQLSESEKLPLRIQPSLVHAAVGVCCWCTLLMVARLLRSAAGSSDGAHGGADRAAAGRAEGAGHRAAGAQPRAQVPAGLRGGRRLGLVERLLRARWGVSSQAGALRHVTAV